MARGELAARGAISGENSHGGGGRKRRIRPYPGTIDPAERWMWQRGSRRGYERDGRRVFAVASSNGNDDARSTMADGFGSAL